MANEKKEHYYLQSQNVEERREAQNIDCCLFRTEKNCKFSIPTEKLINKLIYRMREENRTEKNARTFNEINPTKRIHSANKKFLFIFRVVAAAAFLRSSKRMSEKREKTP